ncbi:MAG TPA: wax ester/triacylglycerol synthase domain-containing protein [Actinophytocola sp.]|jgi:WS/DGAT/MGAT family acyltransferase|uniref:wax ester/triacylglycerol synthase domain-containing protein n=1 Tax=Actinophytocola sp. TaxID=1872138 RepID=UPI002F9532A1
MTGQQNSFMGASDAFSWYQEADPALRATIVAVVWLNRVPDWERLARRVDAATRLVPRLRQRVTELPARLSVPRWVTDEGFDLGWHLRRVTAPAPGDDAAALELARVEAMTGFDRARPLWTYTLVDGLSGGRAAMIMKLHHSLTDGVGAVRLAPVLFDTCRRPAFEPHPHEAPADDHTSLVPAGLAHTAGLLTGMVGKAARGVLPTALHVLKDPLGTAQAVTGTAQSIAATVAPVFDILSPVMRDRGLGRHLDVVTVGLPELKRAAKTAGVTVNDAFLASVTGGMRRYHDAHDKHVDELRVTMPISIRTATDALASNRITLMRFQLPVAEADPARRMARIGLRCRAARNSRSLPFTDAIAAGLDLLPTGFVGGMLKNVDFLASDVTGVPTKLYLAGAKVTAQDAFGPTMGSAANLTLMSYAGTCRIAINTDTAAVPDADVFVDCMRAGFDEVLAVAPPFTPARVLGPS